MSVGGQGPLAEKKKAPGTLDLGTNATDTSTFELHSFEVHEDRRERTITWYDEENRLVLKHFIPRGKTPYTTSSASSDDGRPFISYRDFNEDSQLITHGFARGDAAGRRQLFSPKYYFDNEEQSIRFQCVARQRQLLAVLGTVEIRTRSGPKQLAISERLKLWRTPDRQSLTFTIYAHMSGIHPKRHYEFDLSWFRQEVKCVDNRQLVLTFNKLGDERKSSDSKGLKSGFFSRLMPKKEQEDNVESTLRNPSYPTSEHSSGSSGTLLLPACVRQVVPNPVYLQWRALEIRFSNDQDADLFLGYFRDPESAPGVKLCPEKLWMVKQESEPTLHFLNPVSGSYTSRKALQAPTSDSNQKKAMSYGAEKWFERMHMLREMYFATGLEEGVPPAGIAVLDTGIDDTNPYIANKWCRECNGPDRYRDFINDSAIANVLGAEPWTKPKVSSEMEKLRGRTHDTPKDNTGHGTHVAGIVLQLCPEANLYVGRVLAEDVTLEADETSAAAKRVALAILYATDVWKVKIISLSIGFHKKFMKEEDRKIVRSAIEYATNAKVIMFAASSNSGNREHILFPASERRLFCINSSDGNGGASKFNPPYQDQVENFSILGERVRSTWLQSSKSIEAELKSSRDAAWEVKSGTSIATPIAASVAIMIIHFGRQWEPKNHEILEEREGLMHIFRSMATKNRAKFFDIVPWHGVFELGLEDLKDPIEATKKRFENILAEF